MAALQLLGRIGRRSSLGAQVVLCLALVGRAVSADSEIDKIAELLDLRPGQSVADVGAGDGEWSVGLSRIAGPDGRVLATEIAADAVQRLNDRFTNEGLTNAKAVLAYQRRSGLAVQSCDAVLLRLVYHHLSHPNAVAADLYQVLRPSGRLAIIDFVPQKNLPALAGVPERGGHGVRPEDVVAEMEQAGFRAVARHDAWQGDSQRFCVVFERRAVAPVASPTQD